MGTRAGKTNRIMMYLPFLGMILFVLFYIHAANLYPGGSWQNQDSEGFSIINNYLCDLLDYLAINGELNQGRHFARIALGLLCISIFQIWMYLPRLFPKGGLNNRIFQISALLALITICFLSSEAHDFIIYLAGVLGSIAMLSCFVQLYLHDKQVLLLSGLFCFILFLLNYYIYESRHFVEALPLLQKITMMCLIIWFGLTNITIIRSTNDS